MTLKFFCLLVILIVSLTSVRAEDYVHNPIQYHSQNPRGAYNYGYDTGLYGSHQFHQENKDNQGIVRGRYGYTDPDGNLRLTYYTAGPNGFNVIKDEAAAPQPRHAESVAVTVPVPLPSTPAHHHHQPPSAPLVVTAPCRYRNPPCHQGKYKQRCPHVW